jgi:hypothetical protein
MASQVGLRGLVAGWVGIVSASLRRVITWRVVTWPVITSGGSSTEGSSTDGSSTDADRHSRTYTTTVIATTVNATAINADTSAIIGGRVICNSRKKPDAEDKGQSERNDSST